MSETTERPTMSGGESTASVLLRRVAELERRLTASNAEAARLRDEVEHLTEFGVDLPEYELVVAQRDDAIGRLANMQGVFDAVRDLAWRFVRYGDDRYLVTRGTVHRLVGAMVSAGQACAFRADDREFLPDPPNAGDGLIARPGPVVPDA